MVNEKAAEQLEREMIRAMRVLALVATPEADDVLEQTIWAPGMRAREWVRLLQDPDDAVAARAAEGVKDALWPDGTPNRLAGTALGRLLNVGPILVAAV